MLSRSSTIRTDLPQYTEREARPAPAYSFIELPTPPASVATRLWERFSTRRGDGQDVTLRPLERIESSSDTNVAQSPGGRSGLYQSHFATSLPILPQPVTSSAYQSTMPLPQPRVRERSNACRSLCRLSWPKALGFAVAAAVLVLSLKKFINHDDESDSSASDSNERRAYHASAMSSLVPSQGEAIATTSALWAGALVGTSTSMAMAVQSASHLSL